MKGLVAHAHYKLHYTCERKDWTRNSRCRLLPVNAGFSRLKVRIPISIGHPLITFVSLFSKTLHYITLPYLWAYFFLYSRVYK